MKVRRQSRAHWAATHEATLSREVEGCERTQKSCTGVRFVPVHFIQFLLQLRQRTRRTDPEDRVCAHQTVFTPTRPVLEVIVERKPCLRLTAKHIGPHLKTSRRVGEYAQVHPTVK